MQARRFGRMSHESLARNADDIHGPSNRSFGLTFAVFFLALGLWPLLFSSPPRFWAIGIASTFLLSSLTRPDVLTIPNRLWLKFGLLLQVIVSPIALGILFYGVFTPMGLLIRILFRKNLLATRFEHHAQSYWIHRNPPGPAPDSLTNQF